PAPSCPGTNGFSKSYAGPGGFRTSRSRLLSAAARSSTTISPGPGAGSGTSESATPPPSRTWSACTLLRERLDAEVPALRLGVVRERPRRRLGRDPPGDHDQLPLRKRGRH